MARTDDITEEILSWAEESDQTLLEILGQKLADDEPMGFMGSKLPKSSNPVSNAEDWLSKNADPLIDDYENIDGLSTVELATKIVADVIATSFPTMPLGVLSVIVARRTLNRYNTLYSDSRFSDNGETAAPKSPNKLNDDNQTNLIRAEFDAAAECKRVGNLIAKARTEAGLTQSQLAKLSGLRQPHIARAEAGYNSKIETLARILNAMGYEMDICAEKLYR